ncbi:MAG: hypothetical protein D6674_02210 [Acidobacteria bacterium]|nr:MAG: hypothetical protein D6674_02210 [Acidobacteriota bacterium]
MLLTCGGLVSALECSPFISLEQAISSARQYVGTVQSAQLSKSRSSGECYYRVRGTEGTAMIDAKDGKLLRFYRKR